jgi:hypothetical protein
MATEENFLKSYNLEDDSKLLDSSPEAAEQTNDEDQDPPVTAEVTQDDQARPYPEDEDVVMEEDPGTVPEPEIVTNGGPDLSNFGENYRRALAELVKVHEPFLCPEKLFSKPVVWSHTLKEKRLQRFREASAKALDNLMIQMYKDRNVTFKDPPSCVELAPPLDPKVGEKVAQQVSITKPTNLRCACATVHRAIFTCPIGARDHPQLCQAVIDVRRSIENPPENIPPITLREADATALPAIPKKPQQPVTPSFKPPEEPPKAPQKRGRDSSRGRGKNRSGGQNRDQSQDSQSGKKRWRSNNSQNAQRRINHSKERNPPAQQSGFTPEVFRQLFTSILTPPATPSVAVPEAKSKPGPSSTAVLKPSEHGDKVIMTPDGKIDWRYAPIAPVDFPADRDFDAIVRDGRWHVKITRK